VRNIISVVKTGPKSQNAFQRTRDALNCLIGRQWSRDPWLQFIHIRVDFCCRSRSWHNPLISAILNLLSPFPFLNALNLFVEMVFLQKNTVSQKITSLNCSFNHRLRFFMCFVERGILENCQGYPLRSDERAKRLGLLWYVLVALRLLCKYNEEFCNAETCNITPGTHGPSRCSYMNIWIVAGCILKV
jgi:hypothetical protein